MCIKLVYTRTVQNQMYYPCDVYVISQENSTENIFCLESDNSEMKQTTDLNHIFNLTSTTRFS